MKKIMAILIVLALSLSYMYGCTTSDTPAAIGKKIDKTKLPEYITDDLPRPGESVLKEVLGNNMIWILDKMKNSDGIGRRYLANLAKEEGLPLTEGQIRSLLNSAELLGLVEVSTGRKGTMLTEKGNSILSSIGVNG